MAAVEQIDQVMPVLLALAGVVWRGPRFRLRETGAGHSAVPVSEATLATIRQRYPHDSALHARISKVPFLSERLPATFRDAFATAGRS